MTQTPDEPLATPHPSTRPPSEEHGDASLSELNKLLMGLSNVFIRAQATELDRAIELALGMLGRYAQASSCFLFEFDAALATASKQFEWLAPSMKSTVRAFTGVTPASMATLFPRAAAGERLRVNDLAELGDAGEAEREMLASLSIGAFLCLPVRIQGRVVGLLGFDHRQGGRVWTDDDELVLRLSTEMFAQALDRKRTHNRLDFHIGNAPLGVLEWDEQWRVTRWSPAAERMFGWSADQVMGRSWGSWRFVYEGDLEDVNRTAQRLVEGPMLSNTSINRNYTQDGRVIHCEWFNSVLRDSAGRIVSILSFVQDITERLRVQEELSRSQAELVQLNAELETRAGEALLESELRYVHLAEYATDMISCHQLDGSYLYASQACEALLGYTPQELLNAQPFDMFHPNDTPRIRAGHQAMLETGDPWVVTYRMRHKNGGYVWVETTSRLIEVSEPNTPEIQIVAVSRDAADRKQSEIALRDSESRYRALAEHATDMISCHDDEGRFTYISPACQRLLGYDPEELLGKLPRIIAHPEDRDAVIQSLVRLRMTTDVVSTTFRARRKDGQIIWLEASSRNDGGEIVVVSRDVSSRLDTEQRLRLIQSAVEQVGESVTITDNQLDRPGPHIVYVNPTFTAMTGYEPHEAIGCSPRILQGPKTDQEVLRKLRQCLKQGKPFFGETTNYRKDGSDYVVEWNVNPLRDDRGNITHWVAIQRDITQRKTAADLARVHREELAHVTRLSAMGEMASGLAHEINQPLAAINNYASGALRRIDHRRTTMADLAEALHHIADQSDRAGQIIRRLRAFVIKRGTVRADEHINELIQEGIALLEADILEQQGKVNLDLAPNAALPTIRVDGIQIEQVLVNIIRNAFEAMASNPRQQRRLTISSRLDEGHTIHVTLADLGPGLTASQRDHLFDPFFTTKDDGMGMGLTISQSIIQAHNGRLWVTPGPGGQGTIFHLTLPVSHA
ncbi:MAG: PAS domain S-box protein [Planctomycetota bacterium]